MKQEEPISRTETGVDAKLNIRILTDVEEPRVAEEWRRRTELWPKRRRERRIFHCLIQAIKILRLRRQYDIMVFDSEMLGNMVSLLSAFLPDKTPILMLDCLWEHPRNRLHLMLKRMQFRLQARTVRRFIVWAVHEMRDFSETFSLPVDMFQFIPFHHSLEGFHFEVSEGDYIFSGGDTDRDYRCLLQAVSGLDVKVRIATRWKDWNEGADIPACVEAGGTSPEDFRQLMAGAKIVVLPMRRGKLRSAGQQTFLNAMAMGKPVVVADDKGAGDYIDSGSNGIIVPSGNAEAMRTAIRSLLDNPDHARHMGARAREVYEKFSTTVCMQRVLSAAEEIAGEGRGRNA